MKIIFKGNAYHEFLYWVQKNKKVTKKLYLLLEDIEKQPYSGIGKPEPLKHQLSGYWSRRISKEHRLVYTISDSNMIILSCRYQY
ncbi:MAG: Txe/YoeB family addiction module toxin [Rickettsiales bacterium]|jgi:toxin YoeB|nr:Txe/YoeB family addiction module toxin [Rickettsiales bacterium]